MLKRFSRVLAASALLAGSLAGMAHADQPVINFGIISTESSQNLKSIWEPFLKDMSQQTGYQVKAFFAPDYAGIIQGMRFDKVDIAWYGNKAAMEAVDRARQRRAGLLEPADRQQGQQDRQPRGHVGERQEPDLRQRRSELHVRLPGARLLRVRQEQRRPGQGLQAHPQLQP